jgi:excisionase family DNA binding protein
MSDDLPVEERAAQLLVDIQRNEIAILRARLDAAYRLLDELVNGPAAKIYAAKVFPEQSAVPWAEKLGVRDGAKYLRISRGRFARLIRDHAFDGERDGVTGHWMIARAALDRWLGQVA